MGSIHWHRSGLRAAVCGLALGLGLGCASTGLERQREEEVRARKSNAHYDLGADHLENGRLALALREFMNAERIDPANPRTHYALGEAYLRKGKPAESEQHLLRALELYPEYQEARLLLSVLYIHVERYEDAIAESSTLFDDPTFPGPWRALTNRGWAEFMLGRSGDARRSLEQAREYNRKYWPTLLNLGILESQEGHRLEAIARFEEMLALGPGPHAEAEANYRLAEIYVSLGRRDRAVSHLTAAVAHTPDGRWGKKSEEYLKLLR